MDYNEDFTGRWVEALVDSPESTSLKKGQYAQLLKRKANKITYHLPWKSSVFTCSISLDTAHVWKLMPIGFEPEIMKESDLIGRYIKIIKEGYFGVRANVGDYLKILEDRSKTTGCVVVEKYNVLSKNIITNGEFCTLMPEGFKPIVIEGDKTADSTSSSSSIPEKWCVNVVGNTTNYPKLFKWRREKTIISVGWVNNGFIHSNGRHEPYITDDYKLVTYNYFVSYIYPTFFPEETVDKTVFDIKYVPQVGDCVITENYSAQYDGRILKITKIKNDCCWFEVNDGKTYNSNHNFWSKGNIEKVDESEYLAQSPQKDFPSKCVLDLSAFNTDFIRDVYNPKFVTKNSDELPKNWCIKVTGSYLRNPEIYKWRSRLVNGGYKWTNNGYIHSDNYHSAEIQPNYTEISMDTFMNKVYNPFFGSNSASSKHSNTQLVDSYKGLTFLPDVDDRFII
jgi:hypothetical protein